MKILKPMLWVMILGAGLAGCGDEPIQGDFVSNQPPETDVTSTPPVFGQTSFTVSFSWKGRDPDSEIAGFEWRISNNGADGIVDQADTLESILPWSFTTAAESTFVVSAENDSFSMDTSDPRQGPDDYRFWQTHTFFIRAVDNEGMKDPTPAMVSFTATTLSPTISIDVPVASAFNSCVSAARVLTFGWTAVDPDVASNEPAEVRYLLKRVGGAADDCLTQVGYEATSPIRNDDPGWSDWVAYDAADDSGKTVTLPKQRVGDSFLFAVQARDLAGAVTPTFTWDKNVRHVRIGVDKFPLLLVTERFLGGDSFVSVNKIKAFDIVQGQELRFEWSADASTYAGVIDAFRYGWDVADPEDENDPGWAVAWGLGANWKQAQPRSFLQGSHNFIVQCRDNSGTISRALYQLQVIQIATRAEQRSVLLIDDWKDIGAVSEALDDQWDRRWKEHLLKVAGFQDSDIIDAQTTRARVKFATLNEYKSVVWFTNSGEESFFHTTFAPLNTRTPQFNWLEVYQGQVGNLLLVGPGAVFNSIERGPPSWQFPVVFNVSNGGELGFGEETRPDGTKFNRGTIRYPYTAWCLEAVDIVRPSFTKIFGEAPGRAVRRKACSGIYRARLDDVFLAQNGDAVGSGVTDLQPSGDRKAENTNLQLPFEEFYNVNLTSRSLNISLRSCQTAMFRAEARVDAQDPEPTETTPGVFVVPVLSGCGLNDGAKFNRATAGPTDNASGVTGAPIGVVSTVYSAEKLLPGSEDFLWGFNPMGFDDDQVRAAIRWIIRSKWEISVQR